MKSLLLLLFTLATLQQQEMNSSNTSIKQENEDKQLMTFSLISNPYLGFFTRFFFIITLNRYIKKFNKYFKKIKLYDQSILNLLLDNSANLLKHQYYDNVNYKFRIEFRQLFIVREYHHGKFQEYKFKILQLINKEENEKLINMGSLDSLANEIHIIEMQISVNFNMILKLIKTYKLPIENKRDIYLTFN